VALEQAIAAERLVNTGRNEATNQVVTLEERDSEGRLISTRRIDSWRRGSDGATARRLYDQSEKLIAGEWTESARRRRVYQRGAGVREQAGSENVEALLARGDIWQVDLSASRFAAVMAEAGLLGSGLRETGSAYVLSYESQPNDDRRDQAWQLVRASLTLNRSDLHATEQSLFVRSRAHLKEYRFIEAGYRRSPIESVPGSAFEPGPELTGSVGNIPVPSVDRGLEAVAGREPLSDLELAALEVEARYLLDQVGASLGEQITFTRTPGGKLSIEALVETETRKADLLRAIEPVGRNPAVAVDIYTVAEATGRRGRQTMDQPAAITRFGGTRSEMPAYEDLRRHFANKLGPSATGADIEREVQRFAAVMLNRADEPMKQAWALKRLVDRFTPAELKAMDTTALERWRRMIAVHSGAVQIETEKLRRALEQVYGDRPGVTGEPYSGEIEDVEELAKLVRRLFEMVTTNQRIVSRAFSDSGGDYAASIRSEQFWRSLKNAESLAKRLAVITR
jgi:hypothetical protein